MFEDIIKFSKDSCENNHITRIHIFSEQKGQEQVGHVVLIGSDGGITFCDARYYQDTTGLPLLEGRIRTLGVRVFFSSEDESCWYKDIYFHKGITYTSNHR